MPFLFQWSQKESTMAIKLKKEFIEFKLLLKEIPTILIVIFIISVFVMNLLANKSIVNLPYLALDCGIIVSWFSFLTMDMITKHFGPKAATEVTILGILFSLLFSFIFFIASIIPGIWGESYVEGSQDIINKALNNTIGGTWYVILGSTIAFLASSIVNNFTNYLIGKALKKDGFLSYMLRSYISTALGQFVDNFLFALIVSHVFFSWTMIQCITCSLTGMVVELLCEVIFSFFGFKICKKWEKEEIGKSYFKFREERKNESLNNRN